MKLTLEKLNELIKDEEAGVSTYMELVKVDPHFEKMAQDEERHLKFLLKLRNKHPNYTFWDDWRKFKKEYKNELDDYITENNLPFIENLEEWNTTKLRTIMNSVKKKYKHGKH